MGNASFRRTTFTLELPACEPKDGARRAAAEPSPPTVKRLTSALVVDDNTDARAALASLLSVRGHIVRQAESADAALQELAAHPPDVALIDIGMPHIDGYQLAKRIRNDPVMSSVILVAVTWAAPRCATIARSGL